MDFGSGWREELHAHHGLGPWQTVPSELRDFLDVYLWATLLFVCFVFPASCLLAFVAGGGVGAGCVFWHLA